MNSNETRQGLAALTLGALGALGVVYGNIGTSPLYTMKEVFNPANGVPLDATNIVGAVSVIFWALMVVVTLKYVVLTLRADIRGEGGLVALTALATLSSPARRTMLLLTGVLGATLFYGDSVITPAISVLGAVEGLEVITPAFKPYVMPVSVVIIVGLLMGQRFGTEAVGRLFGPIITVWFVVLGVLGVMQIVQQPAILAALNPLETVAFLNACGWHLFVILGSIVSALTGAEALYADMGHFGARPIRIAWTGLVLPSLALNDMGQGALLMRDPAALASPFYRLFPEPVLIPAVLLATAASVIASLAVISGAYSMTKQAIQLGLLPRMRILNTSEREVGQIYVPQVNWAVMVAVLLASVGFGSSSALASQRRQRDRLFPAAAQLRGRTRHAGADLIGSLRATPC